MAGRHDRSRVLEKSKSNRGLLDPQKAAAHGFFSFFVCFFVIIITTMALAPTAIEVVV